MPNLELLAGCVILQDENILLVKERNQNYYKIPSGTIEQGETPEETAIRETKEETGLDVELTKKSGEYQFNFKERTFLMHAYFAEIVGGNFTPRNTPNETINLITWKPIAKLTAPNSTKPDHIIYSFLGRL